MIEKLREARFLWSNGMKYTGFISMFLSVATLIGVWFKDMPLNIKVLLMLLGSIGYIIIIILFGYLDYRCGFMSKDISKQEMLSPMWIEQIKFNKKLSENIDKILQSYNNLINYIELKGIDYVNKKYKEIKELEE